MCFICTELCLLPLISFMKNSKESFFTFISFNTPHSPMQVPESFLENKKLIKRGRYKENESILKTKAALAMVENLDYNVGRVLDSLKKYNKIEFTGFQEYKYLPQIYQRAKYGLNFTPNLYPLNLQESTKTKEYCASGLKVVSNQYKWVSEFENLNKANFLWYDSTLTHEIIDNYDFKVPDVKKYSWNYIFNDIEFIKFINNIFKN